MQNYLAQIKSLQSKIEFALEESDFEKLADLSTKLEGSVEALVSSPSYKNNVTQQELADIQDLIVSVKKYQQETSLRFKNYTSDVSRKRKMHQAYKR